MSITTKFERSAGVWYSRAMRDYNQRNIREWGIDRETIPHSVDHNRPKTQTEMPIFQKQTITEVFNTRLARCASHERILIEKSVWCKRCTYLKGHPIRIYECECE